MRIYDLNKILASKFGAYVFLSYFCLAIGREHSSVGLEHLPYKQRVGGSTPSAPTEKDRYRFG